MSERMAQARAEAGRRFPRHGEDIGDAYGYDGFMAGATFGVEWADANPAPRTITRDELGAFADEVTAAGGTGEWVSLEDMLAAALGTLGIRVEGDDDE